MHFVSKVTSSRNEVVTYKKGEWKATLFKWSDGKWSGSIRTWNRDFGGERNNDGTVRVFSSMMECLERQEERIREIDASPWRYYAIS